MLPALGEDDIRSLLYAIRYVCTVHVSKIYLGCRHLLANVAVLLPAGKSTLAPFSHGARKGARQRRRKKNGKNRDCKSLRTTGLSPTPRGRDERIFSAVAGIFLTAARATNYLSLAPFSSPPEYARLHVAVSGPIKG